MIDRKYTKNNYSSLIRKRDFKYLSYFEKLFLVLFHRQGYFTKTFANLYRVSEIANYRRNKYPLIFLFHLYLDKMDYEITDLKLLLKQYYYYKSSKSFSNKLNFILKTCFYTTKNDFLKFVIIYDILIRKYYNSHSSLFFWKYNNFNTLKLNWVFNIFLLNAKGRMLILNLDKWSDWYFFNFSDKITKKYLKKKQLTRQETENYNYWRDRKNFFIKLKYWRYHQTYKKIVRRFNPTKLKHLYVSMWKFNITNYFYIIIGIYYRDVMRYFYKIKFSESSITKYINADKINKYSFFYIRKNRIFNKGRYSRNRQLYRTGVYWCLWLNIIMVYGLYFLFYRFSFNFGYIWWGIMILAYSTIFSRIVKYNFFNYFYLKREFYQLFGWYGYIFVEIRTLILSFFKKYLINLVFFNRITKKLKYNFGIKNYILSPFYKFIIKKYFKILEKLRRNKIKFLWRNMNEIDTSWFRYKTIIHCIKELFRALTTF